MKNILTILAAVMAALVSIAAQAASPDSQPGFAASTTNGATTLSYAIISANSVNAGAPEVSFINAGSDLATGNLQFYGVVAQTQATGAGSTTRLDVTGTNQGVNWQAGTCIIRHMADDSYEKRTLAANTGSTNIVVSVAPLGTMVSGDIIYYCKTNATIKWGASTNSLGPGRIYVGQNGKPLLVDITATTAGTVNCISGTYLNPR